MGLVDGKCGLVTGSAGGIGRAVARRLSAEGASVLVTDLESSRDGGEETVRLIEGDGGRASFVAGDVATEDDQARLVRECVSAYGRLDFAHNNAGVELHGTVEATSVEEWDHLMDVNLIGVWLGMKHQMAQMRKQGDGGSIINTASLAGVMGFPGFAAYVAAKWGVIGLTRAGAIEGADASIRVNAICPTAVRTPMIDRFAPDMQEQLIRPQAIKRISEPEEVAEAVIWLASDRSSLVTGGPFYIELGTVAGFAV
jgi:NAD(P)-dependent dehydrogenase (short-subunit alcohol dehydrogenase family)